MKYHIQLIGWGVTNLEKTGYKLSQQIMYILGATSSRHESMVEPVARSTKWERIAVEIYSVPENIFYFNLLVINEIIAIESFYNHIVKKLNLLQLKNIFMIRKINLIFCKTHTNIAMFNTQNKCNKLMV